MDKILFSHNTDNWRTPTWLYNIFINELKCIDPCPFMCDKDNLKKRYHNKIIYINPPYSDIKSWVSFIRRNHKDNLIFLLIPSRTDTQYFYQLVKMSPIISFVIGRLRFNDGGVAPFPSMLMLFHNGLLPFYQTLKQNEVRSYLLRCKRNYN